MGDNSKIEWTDCTDNIIVVGTGGWWCRKISPECDNCYAETLNQNTFFGGNHLSYTGESPSNLILRRDLLARWARQTKPRKHFVMSLSDVFGEWVPQSWHFEILDAMLAAPTQTFQLLTKRANVALKSIKLWMMARGLKEAPAHIWIGFTAGDQKRFDKRWFYISQLAAYGFTIFVSAEPLLGELILPEPFLRLGKRAQVIVGGESGKNARPMSPAWARSLRDQCVAAGVQYFFKQWGEWAPEIRCDGTACHYQSYGWPEPIDLRVHRVGKKAAGRLLDGREWNQFPEASRA